MPFLGCFEQRHFYLINFRPALQQQPHHSLVSLPVSAAWLSEKITILWWSDVFAISSAIRMPSSSPAYTVEVFSFPMYACLTMLMRGATAAAPILLLIPLPSV